MNTSAIYTFAPAIVLMLLTAYLLYIRRNRELFMRKFKPGTPEHKKYSKLLDLHLLILAILFTFYFVTDAAYRIYGVNHRSVHLVVVEFVIVAVTSVIGLVVVYDWATG